MNKEDYKKKYKKLRKAQEELRKDHKDSMQRLEDSMRELEQLIGPSDSEISSESHQLYTDGAAEFDDDYKPINAAIGGLLKKRKIFKKQITYLLDTLSPCEFNSLHFRDYFLFNLELV